MVPPGSAGVGKWPAIGDEPVPGEGLAPRPAHYEWTLVSCQRQSYTSKVVRFQDVHRITGGTAALLAKVTSALKLR
ncbi:MAG: hypothetical protein P9C36_07205 [Defluviicoccus sp.]|nr:hypothetical protein [Defluviicoccus sp.]MDG4592395.1 hypothetical protein [Defluviicoccus sp.]